MGYAKFVPSKKISWLKSLSLFLLRITSTPSHLCVKSFEPESLISCRDVISFHSVAQHWLRLQTVSKPNTSQNPWLLSLKSLPTCCFISIAVSCVISIAHFDISVLGRWVCLFSVRGVGCSLPSTRFSHASCLTDAGADCLWQLSGCTHQTVCCRTASITAAHISSSMWTNTQGHI